MASLKNRSLFGPARRWGILALAMAFASNILRGEEPESLRLWPDGAPGETAPIGPEHYQPQKSADDDILRLTDVGDPTITIYQPPVETAVGTAVLVCPGGGYYILAMNHEGTEVADWLNSIGVTAVLLKYRVPRRENRPPYAAPLQDAQRAMGLVRHYAARWNIDPHRIGVLGFSAGGHLAAALSTNYSLRTYTPLDGADQESCRPDFAMLLYPGYLEDEEEQGKLSPELLVNAQTPPTILIHTQDDRLVDNSLVYYRALKDAGVPVTMHLYSSGGHGYGIRPVTHLVATWPERCEEWMRSIAMLPDRSGL